MIVVAVLLVAFGLGFWPPVAAYPPPPPTKKQLLGRLRKVQADMTKVEADESAELGKIWTRYAPQRTKLAKPLYKTFAEIGKLRHEEWTELSKAIDPAKVKAIKEKYAPDLAALEKQIKPKEEAMVKVTAKRDAEIAKLESDWSAELAKLDAPAIKAAELRVKERAELQGLIDTAKAKEIEATFSPKFAELDKKSQALTKAMAEANTKRLADNAAIQTALQAQLDTLDPPDNRLSAQVAQVRAERQAALADADTLEKKKEVQDGFDPQIKPLLAKAKDLEQDMAHAQRLAADQRGAAEAAYWATIAKLDPPEDRLEDKRILLYEEERAEIAKSADPAKVKAVHAKYDAQIETLNKKMQSREGDIAHLAHKKRELEAKIIAAWHAQMMKSDPSEEALELKVLVLKAKEQNEMRKALDPAKERAIHAKFEPKLMELGKKLYEQEQALSAVAQKQRDEMAKAIDNYNGKLAPMQKHANDLIVQFQTAKK